MARARSSALAGLTPSRCWLPRSQSAAPSMAASSRPTWNSPTSRQMSSHPASAASGNSARSFWATSVSGTPHHNVFVVQQEPGGVV
eukprot:2226453-Alexandrium_andersonii.AAC.1